MPNQDAFLIKEYDFGVILAVADGMGSRKYAHIGSHAACESVHEAIRIWNHKGRVNSDELILLIHLLWKMSIHPNEAADCGTTCLFVVHFNDGQVVMGQIGDGAVFYWAEDEFFVLSEKEDDFINTTYSLDQVKTLSEWTVKRMETHKQNFKVFMATDGVSERLLADKRKDVLFYMTDEIRNIQSFRGRNRKLKSILNHWDTEVQDDKTMVVMEYEVSNDG